MPRARAALVVALAAVGALGGCDTPQVTIDEVACTTVCRCFSTTPAGEDECVTECIGDLGPVAEDCATCINLHATACDTLADDCGALCSPQEPPQMSLQSAASGGDSP